MVIEERTHATRRYLHPDATALAYHITVNEGVPAIIHTYSYAPEGAQHVGVELCEAAVPHNHACFGLLNELALRDNGTSRLLRNKADCSALEIAATENGRCTKRAEYAVEAVADDGKVLNNRRTAGTDCSHSTKPVVRNCVLDEYGVANGGGKLFRFLVGRRGSSITRRSRSRCGPFDLAVPQQLGREGVGHAAPLLLREAL